MAGHPLPWQHTDKDNTPPQHSWALSFDLSWAGAPLCLQARVLKLLDQGFGWSDGCSQGGRSWLNQVLLNQVQVL